MSTRSLTPDPECLFVMDKGIRAKPQRGETKVTHSTVGTLLQWLLQPGPRTEPWYKAAGCTLHLGAMQARRDGSTLGAHGCSIPASQSRTQIQALPMALPFLKQRVHKARPWHPSLRTGPWRDLGLPGAARELCCQQQLGSLPPPRQKPSGWELAGRGCPQAGPVARGGSPSVPTSPQESLNSRVQQRWEELGGSLSQPAGQIRIWSACGYGLSSRSELLAEEQSEDPRPPMSSLHSLGTLWGGNSESVTSSPDPQLQPLPGTETDLRVWAVWGDRGPGWPKALGTIPVHHRGTRPGPTAGAAGPQLTTTSRKGVALSSSTGPGLPESGWRGKRRLNLRRYEEGKGGLCSDLLFLNSLAPDGKLKADR